MGMLRVGLTGGIATGKSTVAELLRARGCRLLNADRIAHELMAPPAPAYEEIVNTFGRAILSRGGAINRQRLGALVFADAAKRERLNSILHPRVIEEVEREFARLGKRAASAIAVVEAALLVEAGYHRRLDKLVVTWCRPEQQVERLVKNQGFARAQAEQRVAAQLPQQEKRQHADFTIDCSGTLAETEAQTEEVYRELRRLAEADAATA